MSSAPTAAASLTPATQASPVSDQNGNSLTSSDRSRRVVPMLQRVLIALRCTERGPAGIRHLRFFIARA